MQIQPCCLDGAAGGRPQLRLVQGLDEGDRNVARLQARAALVCCLAAELGCAEAELKISNLRGQAPQVQLRGQLLKSLHCSISHAQGMALLAWHFGAAVGVDIQAVDRHVSRPELQAVAQLFFAPEVAEVLSDIAVDALFFEAFAQAWAGQEARLKCAGLGLVEWSGELEAGLAGIHSASVPLPVSSTAIVCRAAVAWKDKAAEDSAT